MAYIATSRGKDLRVVVEEPQPGQYVVRLGDREYRVDGIEPQPGLLSLLVEGRSFEVDLDPRGDRCDIWIQGDHYPIEVVEERKKKLAMKLAHGAAGRQDLRSPMAGNVRQILVKAGDVVARGDVLMILEAMKMQNEIRSPIDGRVSSLSAREGVAVGQDEPLCVVEPLAQDQEGGSHG